MPDPDALLALANETDDAGQAAAHPRAGLLLGLADQLDAEQSERQSRGFSGNVAAGYDAAVAGTARGLAGVGNAIRVPDQMTDYGSGWALMDPTGSVKIPDPILPGPSIPGETDRLVGGRATAAISQNARTAEMAMGGSKVAGLTKSGIDLGKWFVPGIGPAVGAVDAAGNQRLDTLEQGGSETKANLMGLGMGAMAIAAPAAAGKVLAGPAGAMAAKISTALGGKTVGAIAGGVAEHALTGAGTGASLGAGDAAVSAAGGDFEQAGQSLESIPEQMAIGAGIGGVTGAVHGAGAARDLAAGARAREMARAVDEAHVGAMDQFAGQQTANDANTQGRDMAAAVSGPAMEQARDGVPPAFTSEEQVQEEGGAELARMQAEAQQTRDTRALVDDADQNQQIQQLRMQHADDLARLGYPVEPPIDMLAERQAREAQDSADLAARAPVHAAEAEEAELTPPVEQPRRLITPEFQPDDEPAISAPIRQPTPDLSFGTPLEAGRVMRATAPRGGQPVPAEAQKARNRAQFTLDPRRKAKVAALRRDGLTMPEITQLIDTGQLESALQSRLRGDQRQRAADVATSGPAAHAEAEEEAIHAAPSDDPAPPEAPAVQARPVDRPNRPEPVGDETQLRAGARSAPGAGDLQGERQASGLVAPDIAPSPRPEPLAEHGDLPAVKRVLDPSRRPPQAAPPERIPEERQAAVAANQPYQGNKRAAHEHVTRAVRGAFGEDAKKITTVHDPFGGGGGYALSIANAELPNARKIVMGERNQGRLDKIKFIHDNGSQLLERAKATGMYDAVKGIWENLYAERGQASGGGVQGRARKALDDYFAPGGAGDQYIAEHHLDPSETRGTAYALVDGMDRGVKSFDELIASAVAAAHEGEVAAETFRIRGGKIEYRQGDAFTQKYEGGPETMMLLDPPYVGTTGYENDAVGTHELYGKTADLLEQSRREGKSAVYTDEAWWNKRGSEKSGGAPAMTPEQAQANDHVLDRAQAAVDHWSFYPVAKRVESVAVNNGFKLGTRERAYAEHAKPEAERAVEPVKPGETPKAPPIEGAKRAPEAVAPASASSEMALHDQARANLAEQRRRLEASRKRGGVTEAQAEDRYRAMHEREVERLRERLSPEQRQANEVERATAERSKDVPTDPARREALRKALTDRKLPGTVKDDPLGVRLDLKNGSSILFVDSGVPEAQWSIKNWTASVLSRPGGTAALQKAITKAFGSTDSVRTIKQIENMSRARQLKLMREIPPVAGVIEGPKGAPRAHAFDADFVIHAGKVVDSLITGGKGREIDEEMGQVIWRLMPDADRKAVLPELKRFGFDGTDTKSVEAEEAAAQWMQRHREALKPLVNEPSSLLGKGLRAVRSALGKLLPFLKSTPHVEKSAAEEVYERVKRGDYLGARGNTESAGEAPFRGATAGTRAEAAAPQSRFATRVPAPEDGRFGSPEAMRLRQKAAEEGKLDEPKPSADDETRVDLPPVRMSTEQSVREALREGARSKGDIPSQSDKDVEHNVDALQERLGTIDAQREHRDGIIDKAMNGEMPGTVEQAFIKRLIQHEASTLDRTHTPDAARRYLEAQTQDAIVGSLMGAAFRQRRFDINDETARTGAIRHLVHQIRGAEREQYEKALKARARARTANQPEKAARAQARIDTIREKARERHNSLRAELMRKYGIDLDDPNIGNVFQSRYSIGELMDTIAAHRRDFTIGDRLSTSFTEGVLSLPTTLGKNVLGNGINYVWQTHTKPAMEALGTALGMGDESTRSFGELRHMYSAAVPGLRAAFKGMREAYFAGHDVNEAKAVGSHTGIGLFEDGKSHHAPSLIKSLTGIDMSYVSTRMHSALDAFFKTWAAHSFVAGEAYRVARGEGLTGDAVGERIHSIISGGPEADESGAWEHGYRQAKRVTFQESFDKKMTPDNVRTALNGIVKISRARVGVGKVDIQPGAFVLPFIGTPFGILRQGASKVAPLQAIKMLARMTGGAYSKHAEGGRAKLLNDAAELAIGTGLTAALAGMAHKDDDKTWITGSESDFRSGTGAMERRKTVAPPRSLWIPGLGWRSYKNLEPFATAVAPLVDMMRGKGVKQAATGLSQGWMLEQAHDLASMAAEIKNLDAKPSDWTSADPEAADKLTKGTRDMRHFLVNTVSGIAVPNLIRGGIKLGRSYIDKVEEPTVTSAPRPNESAAGLVGTNLLQAMSGGAFHSAPSILDIYGREIPNGLATASDMFFHLLGVDNKPTNPIPWDSMLVKWNRQVEEEGLHDKAGKSLSYTPDNWPTTYKWRGKTFAKTPEQAHEFSLEAGREFNARLQAAADRDALHPDNPTKHDIERYKEIKAAVHSSVEHRLARAWQVGAE